MSTKKTSLKNLVTITGFAAVTAAATLAVCAPRTTFADGDDADRMGEYTDDGTKFDDIVVKGEIQKDAHSKTGYLVLITAKNTADHPETLSLETDMQRSFTTPEARVSDPAVSLYKQTQSVTVAAQSSVTISRPVPAWVVPQIETGERIVKARAAAQRKLDEGADFQQLAPVVYAPFPSFAVAFYRGETKPAAGAAPQPAVAAPAPPVDVAAPSVQPAPVAAR